MPEYPPGAPCWVDLSSPDLDASVAFYSDLFGWVGRTLDAAGRYRVLTLDGRSVAGLGPVSGDLRPAWTTYVRVVDAEATGTAVVEAGGALVQEAVELPGAGRLAAFADPAGAAFAVWQAGEIRGAELAGAPGAFCWHELATRDPEGAAAFYPAVFGWRPATDAGTGYTEWCLGDRLVAGMVALGEEWPPDVPDHWMVYFGVEDCEASARRVAELGGRVLQPPTDIPPGRYAALADPHGSVFSVIGPGGSAG